jgi:hypothetical protein
MENRLPCRSRITQAETYNDVQATAPSLYKASSIEAAPVGAHNQLRDGNVECFEGYGIN